MPSLVSNGLTIAYEVHGDGPPIVLLHGFTSSFKGNWQETGWVDFLTRHGYQVVGPDLRGHGASDKPHSTAAYVTAKMAADVLNLLDHLSIARADLLGFSMGGGIALHLGMERAERVRAAAVAGVGDAAIAGYHDPRQLAEIAEALECDDPASIASPLAQQIRAHAERTNNDLAALAAMMRGKGWPGYLEEMKPIACPVLIVEAEHDQFMRGTERLMLALPHARRVVIHGLNHNALVRDQRFKDAVLSLIRHRFELRSGGHGNGDRVEE